MLANNATVVHSADPAALSSELMFGNMLQAVGVHAVNSYYGMGFKAFTDAARVMMRTTRASAS